MNTPTSGKSEPVSVRVLDREYTVGVSDAERDSLSSAARMLDARMRELRVARYFPQPPSVSAGGNATQLVEIEVIDQSTQTVSTLNMVLVWRWDMEDKRWWLMTPPPDLDARD